MSIVYTAEAHQHRFRWGRRSSVRCAGALCPA